MPHLSFVDYKLLISVGISQMVRHRILIPACTGSSPVCPVIVRKKSMRYNVKKMMKGVKYATSSEK